MYSYERGREYSTLEGVLFSKLLFERRSICLRHVITTVYRQWFRFLCQRLLGSIQGCFKSHHLKNKLPFIILIFAVVPKTRYNLMIISRCLKPEATAPRLLRGSLRPNQSRPRSLSASLEDPWGEGKHVHSYDDFHLSDYYDHDHDDQSNQIILTIKSKSLAMKVVYCCLYDCPLTNVDIIGDNENFLPYTDQKRYISLLSGWSGWSRQRSKYEWR